jgi:hypothetical protein
MSRKGRTRTKKPDVWTGPRSIVLEQTLQYIKCLQKTVDANYVTDLFRDNGTQRGLLFESFQNLPLTVRWELRSGSFVVGCWLMPSIA